MRDTTRQGTRFHKQPWSRFSIPSRKAQRSFIGNQSRSSFVSWADSLSPERCRCVWQPGGVYLFREGFFRESKMVSCNGFFVWKLHFAVLPTEPLCSLVRAVRGLPYVAMLIPRTELVSTKQVTSHLRFFDAIWCYIIVRVWFLILLCEVLSIWSCDRWKAHCS